MNVSKNNSKSLDQLDLLIIDHLRKQESTVAELTAIANVHDGWKATSRQSIDFKLKKLLSMKFVQRHKIGQRRVRYQATEAGNKAQRDAISFLNSL